MSDDNKNDKSSEKPAPATGGSGKWSTGAKVGAAIGSAAIAAALMYAGRHQMKKHDDFKPVKDKPLPKYENEPDYDDGDDYGEEE
ncbi:hypothetical protein [Parasphingorhabdus flavimaris]|jgi:hypothetical protein|uniref:DUF4366 domain-containing protein n=1 Tax=Parasphingorhabdus flavimaris TaxID=266812 RepID=A0ABX2MY77_9SPHN|nr:hypothetical protein [Parasphingorhabdus flavimaris]NVD26390.1 hypothetical protein [Parasphingorhabdus flavimaris]|tara:strand:- start:2124 stop:2378 length:255 start_codon:yes stop_codon:yes gene_type:complete